MTAARPRGTSRRRDRRGGACARWKVCRRAGRRASDALAVGTPNRERELTPAQTHILGTRRGTRRDAPRLATLEAFVRGECHAGAMATADFLWKTLEAHEKDAAAGDDVAAGSGVPPRRADGAGSRVGRRGRSSGR